MSEFVNSLVNTGLSTAFRPVDHDITANQQEYANDQLIKANQATNIVNELMMLDNGTQKYVVLDSGGEGVKLNTRALLDDGHGQLVLDMFNTTDRFRSAKDDKGRNIQVEAIGFVPNPDTGNIMVEVRRPDGRPAPLTERRSGDADDPVVQFDSMDIDSIGTSAFQRQLSRSGYDAIFATHRSIIDKSLYDEATTVNDLRETILTATDQIPDDAMRNQLYSVAERMDYAGLREMADQMGIDVAAIDANAQTQFNQSQEARGIPTAENAVVDESMDPPPVPASKSMDLGVVSARRQELHDISENGYRDFEYDPALGGGWDQQFNAYKQAIDSEQYILDNREAMLNARDVNVFELEEEIDRLEREINLDPKGHRGDPQGWKADVRNMRNQVRMHKRAVEFFAQEKALQDFDGAIPLESSPTPMTYEELVTEGLQSAIQGVAEADSAAVRKYLQDNNISSIEGLAGSDVPLEEALNAIRVIAAYSDDPSGTYKDLWNTVATGIEGVSPLELMQQKAVSTTAAANLTRAQTAARKQIAEDGEIEFKDVDDRMAELRAAGTALREVVVGDNGRFQNPNQAITAANNIVFEAESIIEDPRIDPADKLDAQRTAVRALSEMLAAKMATNDRAWFDLLGKFSDWLTPNPRAPLGGEVMEHIVPGANGGYTFLTGNGGQTDGDITAGQVASLFGDDAVDIFRELAEFNEKAQAARGVENGQEF